jgi:antitoxin Phd
MPADDGTKHTKSVRSGRQTRPAAAPSRLAELPGWKLEEAKSRLSQLVRVARTQGPQRITLRGEDAVVVIAADEFARLMAGQSRESLSVFLRRTGLADIDVTREEDRGRELAL